MSVSEAYEKMFEDGSAFKPIKIAQPMPTLAEAQGGGGSPTPDMMIGEKLETTGDPDYSHFDSIMEEKVNNVRTRLSGGSNTQTANEELESIKNRLKMVETALTLVMEQQMEQKKLIKELNEAKKIS